MNGFGKGAFFLSRWRGILFRLRFRESPYALRTRLGEISAHGVAIETASAVVLRGRIAATVLQFLSQWQDVC